MPRIEISIPEQSLALLENGRELRHYLVSTSRNGPGEQQGSFCTPRGEHIVRAKIGTGQPLNTVFVRRRPTGEIWTPEMAERFPSSGSCQPSSESLDQSARSTARSVCTARDLASWRLDGSRTTTGSTASCWVDRICNTTLSLHTVTPIQWCRLRHRRTCSSST